MKTGRNDLCPCGSGKKFKRCCLSQASVVSNELRELIAEQEFNSLEEVQAFAGQFMQQRNQQSQDDFQGLSPEQVHRMLNFAFDSPELFCFSNKLASEPEAPILSLAQKIIDAIDQKGLKATAKGNLPQKLCRSAALNFLEGLPDNAIRRRMVVS
jgi:hypothetical protein